MKEKVVDDKRISNGVKKIYPYAVISFVLGIISFFQILGLERALLAVVFGVIALKKMNEDEKLKGRKFAYSGIILGIVYLIILCVIIIFKGSDILNILGSK